MKKMHGRATRSVRKRFEHNTMEQKRKERVNNSIRTLTLFMIAFRFFFPFAQIAKFPCFATHRIWVADSGCIFSLHLSPPFFFVLLSPDKIHKKYALLREEEEKNEKKNTTSWTHFHKSDRVYWNVIIHRRKKKEKNTNRSVEEK